MIQDLLNNRWHVMQPEPGTPNPETEPGEEEKRGAGPDRYTNALQKS